MASNRFSVSSTTSAAVLGHVTYRGGEAHGGHTVLGGDTECPAKSHIRAIRSHVQPDYLRLRERRQVRALIGHDLRRTADAPQQHGVVDDRRHPCAPDDLLAFEPGRDNGGRLLVSMSVSLGL